ncbi:MAG: peptidylprolyl isomerase [Nitrospirota bacterium]
MNSKSTNILLFSICCIVFAVFCGCASLPREESVLAVVDGDPITEFDLKYALAIAHRKEDLSGAGTIDIRQYVYKLVDERLIMNEARNAGMDRYPEVRQAVEAFILRESVVKLHDEEIIRKVSVTDRELEDSYDKNYARFVLRIIQADSEDKARTIMDELKQGGDFVALAQKYSRHPAQHPGEEITLTGISISSGLREPLQGMTPGETSDPVQIDGKYYLLRLVRRQEASPEGFAKVRKQMDKAIRKQKEKARSDEFLAYLRTKARIIIDYELLSEVNLNCSGEKRAKCLEDGRTLAAVNDATLAVSDFISSIPPGNRESKERLLDGWVERKLVDHEALSRHYENDPEMMKSIRRYEDQLLKDTFIRRIIFPRIAITEERLKDYYTRNTDEFRTPVCYKIRQITVKNREEADEIVRSLSGNADFGWLAKKKSVDPYAEKGGDAGCLMKKDLPEPVGNILDTLKRGETGQIVQDDQMFRIYMMGGREGGSVEKFEKVREAVHRACFAEQLDALMKKYVNQLKTGARIHFYSDEISAFEKKFKT